MKLVSISLHLLRPKPSETLKKSTVMLLSIMKLKCKLITVQMKITKSMNYLMDKQSLLELKDSDVQKLFSNQPWSVKKWEDSMNLSIAQS